ncbi:hypothetical protein QQ045_012078 [Rhodiola kirilowii]
MVDKNPGKVVSLFWVASVSNVETEAIKFFRSLGLPESLDSLDSVLVELYQDTSEGSIFHRKGRLQVTSGDVCPKGNVVELMMPDNNAINVFSGS